MITIRLWAHKIAPIVDDVKAEHFRAIEICENTANLLANMFGGKTDCSSCGVVQYSDTVILPSLTEDQKSFITSTYPFVSIIEVTKKPIVMRQLIQLYRHYQNECKHNFPGFINTHLFTSFRSYMEHAWGNDYCLAIECICK